MRTNQKHWAFSFVYFSYVFFTNVSTEYLKPKKLELTTAQYTGSWVFALS